MQKQKNGVTRRDFLKIMATSAAPLALAACAAPAAPAPASGGESQAAAPAGEVTDVRFVAMDYDSRMQPDTQAVMDAFNASQSAVKATLEVVGWPDGRNVLGKTRAHTHRSAL